MKKAVLLINLGTPKSPAKKDVRRYLTQFLNDPRVIDINPISRFFLVNGIIVPFRAGKSAKLYEKIWTKEGSPLLIHGINLQKKLQKELGENYVVELAMRYQEPSISAAIERLKKANISSITVLPLYPQYATSSTTSSIEETEKVLKKWPSAPQVKYIQNFFVEIARQYNFNNYDHFLFSYHGLPERQITKASAEFSDGSCKIGSCCDVITDKNRLCYRANCYETTRQLVKNLNIPEGKYTSAFQSRLDDKWLKPYSDKVIEELAKKGVKNILVFSPAFVADCLETIYEIGTEYDEIFKEHGGESVTLVRSLNDSDVWVKALKNMIVS
jgi:ferrochelatase